MWGASKWHLSTLEQAQQNPPSEEHIKCLIAIKGQVFAVIQREMNILDFLMEPQRSRYEMHAGICAFLA